ncbi:hypothetical protein [Nitrosomonas mobilis]|uniref:Uncharacterized protein n=1 Tax=Nitrosomonas mobilis TaxID=51642 RepID=A0A1G5SEM5_9PROT|nr:hypothetical protein [Nitrosomonas mobilis]SCZ85572.1 hypothetical protein NSMM_400050 [Nitrosomonas mobilis]
MAARPVTSALTQEQTQQIFARYHTVLDECNAINPEAKREGARRGRIKQIPAINLPHAELSQFNQTILGMVHESTVEHIEAFNR